MAKQKILKKGGKGKKPWPKEGKKEEMMEKKGKC